MIDEKQNIDFSILDSLRGIAALYVVIKHSRSMLFTGLNALVMVHPQAAWTFIDYITLSPLIATRLGREFVVFFFVLSGFSIAHSLGNKPAIAGFYLRRIVRLYPPYLFALAWAAVIFLGSYHLFPHWYTQPALNDHSDAAMFANGLYQSRDFLSWPVILGNLFFIPKGMFIQQFWALTYEVLFYLGAPFFLCRKPLYYAVSLVLYIGGEFGLGRLVPWGIVSAYIFEFNFYFAIGAFCHSYWPRVQKVLFMPMRRVVVLSIMLFCIMLALNMKLGHITRYGSVVSALLMCVLMANILGHNIRIKPLMWVGKFSYSLYITHVAAIIGFIFCLFLFTPVRFPIYSRWLWLAGIPISLLVGYLSYLIVEKQSKFWLNMLRK